MCLLMRRGPLQTTHTRMLKRLATKKTKKQFAKAVRQERVKMTASGEFRTKLRLMAQRNIRMWTGCEAETVAKFPALRAGGITGAGSETSMTKDEQGTGTGAAAINWAQSDEGAVDFQHDCILRSVSGGNLEEQKKKQGASNKAAQLEASMIFRSVYDYHLQVIKKKLPQASLCLVAMETLLTNSTATLKTIASFFGLDDKGNATWATHKQHVPHSRRHPEFSNIKKLEDFYEPRTSVYASLQAAGGLVGCEL